MLVRREPVSTKPSPLALHARRHVLDLDEMEIAPTSPVVLAQFAQGLLVRAIVHLGFKNLNPLRGLLGIARAPPLAQRPAHGAALESCG